MIGLMLGALRSRGQQTLTVMVLAILAVAAAAAAPWYVLALRTPLPPPLVITGGRVDLDIVFRPFNKDSDLRLSVQLAPLSGDRPVLMRLGPLSSGRQTVGQDTAACRAGCRLVGLGMGRNDVQSSFGATLTVHELRTTEPTAVAIPAAPWAATGAWQAHTPSRTTLSGAADGLHITFAAQDGTREESWIAPADGPPTVPVAATAALPAGTRLVGLDGLPTPVEQVARLSGLPRLGRMGAVVDLNVADRISTDAGGVDDEEVWLGPAAPADAAQRLKDQGLVVTGDTALTEIRAGLDDQSGALALTFYLLAAVLVVVLAAGGLRLVTAVDRDRGAADLRALRVQGVPRRLIGRAGLLGYLVVVLAALVVGPLVAAVTWLVAGGSLPTAAGDQSLWPAPRWPGAVPVLWPWAVTAAILVAVALVAAIDLRRKVRQSVDLSNEVN
jgi:putative ABC transport system permease protein